MFAHRVVFSRQKGLFDRQNPGVDETLPGHEVQNPVQLLDAADPHQTPNHDVLSARLCGQDLLQEQKSFTLDSDPVQNQNLQLVVRVQEL